MHKYAQIRVYAPIRVGYTDMPIEHAARPAGPRFPVQAMALCGTRARMGGRACGRRKRAPEEQRGRARAFCSTLCGALGRAAGRGGAQRAAARGARSGKAARFASGREHR